MATDLEEARRTGAGKGALTGAATGAALGSAVGPVGTAVGGALGAATGAIVGGVMAGKAEKERQAAMKRAKKQQAAMIADRQVAARAASDEAQLATRQGQVLGGGDPDGVLVSNVGGGSRFSQWQANTFG